jgi:hypothetical protein
MIIYGIFDQKLNNSPHYGTYVSAEISLSKTLAQFLELESYVRCLKAHHGTDILLVERILSLNTLVKIERI